MLPHSFSSVDTKSVMPCAVKEPNLPTWTDWALGRIPGQRNGRFAGVITIDPDRLNCMTIVSLTRPSLEKERG